MPLGSSVVEACSWLLDTCHFEASTLLQQSGSAMAQLCMWQLVIGYNLRELEVRDQLQKQLGASNDDASD